MTMTTTALTLEAAHTTGHQLATRHLARFVEFVAGFDEAALARPVPGSDWTVGETFAHVQSVVLRYGADPRRAATPQGVAEQNAEDVARLGVDVAAGARAMTEQLDSIGPALPHVAPDKLFPFHAGQSTTMAGGWGNLLGELLVHGDDIARATWTTFTIPSADLDIMWRFTAPLLQGWLRPETASLDERWRLRFPFGDIDVLIADGTLHWDAPVEAMPDRIIEVDDVTEFTLTFPYRRRPITNPTIALLASRFRDL